MPQPLSRVRPNAKFILDPGSLDDKPELAQLVGRIIALSSDIDIEIGLLLVRILGGNAKVAIAMYSALRQQSWQRMALVAAAEAALKPEQFEVFSAVVGVAESAQKPRHKLAHCVWAKSPDIPDALLLADPDAIKETQLAIARFPFLTVNDDEAAIELARRHWEIDRSDILVYTRADLQRIVNDLNETVGMLIHFRHYMNPLFSPEAEMGAAPGTLSETASGALRQLSNGRLFREALDRVKESQKNNPQSRNG